MRLAATAERVVRRAWSAGLTAWRGYAGVGTPAWVRRRGYAGVGTPAPAGAMAATRGYGYRGYRVRVIGQKHQIGRQLRLPAL
jgi:hypothetical protein